MGCNLVWERLRNFISYQKHLEGTAYLGQLLVMKHWDFEILGRLHNFSMVSWSVAISWQQCEIQTNLIFLSKQRLLKVYAVNSPNGEKSILLNYLYACTVCVRFICMWYIHMQVCESICLYVHDESVSGGCWVSCSVMLHLILLRQGLSLYLDHFHLGWLVSPLFYMDLGI